MVEESNQIDGPLASWTLLRGGDSHDSRSATGRRNHSQWGTYTPESAVGGGASSRRRMGFTTKNSSDVVALMLKYYSVLMHF